METLSFATDATWLRFTLETLAVLTISYCVYKQDAINEWEEKHLHPLIKKFSKKLFGKYYARKEEESRILAECEEILANSGVNKDYEELLEKWQ
jgi:hypothetical protein